MSLNIFVISKPLQYFNATNILVNEKKICIIINNFYNAEKVFKGVRESSSYWNDVFFEENWNKAFKNIIERKKSIKRIFIDSDFGFRKNLILRKLKDVEIYCYEEGIGNYRPIYNNDIFFEKLKFILYKNLGHQNYIGGSKYTKGIYLYNTSLFNEIFPNSNKKILFFSNPFSKHLEEFKDKSIFLSSSALKVLNNIRDTKVLLYLTSWSYDSKIQDRLQSYHDYVKILKLHPHIKDTSLQTKYYDYYDYVINGENLIELIISKLLKVNESVLVMHHGTSALMYFNKQQNLKTLKI